MNEAVDVDALYENLEQMGVDVFSCPLAHMDALAEPEGYLGINPKRITSQAQERELLIHEEGHFATSTFYQLDSPYTVRRHQENVATRYGFKKYYSVEKLLDLMEDGCTEPWQLAERLGVRQAYAQEILTYYREQGVDFSRLLAQRRARREQQAAREADPLTAATRARLEAAGVAQADAFTESAARMLLERIALCARTEPSVV